MGATSVRTCSSTRTSADRPLVHSLKAQILGYNSDWCPPPTRLKNIYEYECTTTTWLTYLNNWYFRAIFLFKKFKTFLVICHHSFWKSGKIIDLFFLITSYNFSAALLSITQMSALIFTLHPHPLFVVPMTVLFYFLRIF